MMQIVALAETAKAVAQEEETTDKTCSNLEQVSKPARGPSIQPVNEDGGPCPSDEGFRTNLAHKPQGGRPPGPTPGSYRDIEDRTGIPQATIRRAEQHVAAIEAHPEVREEPHDVRQAGTLRAHK